MDKSGWLNVLKQIIRKAAEIGLNEAGSRIIGGQWATVKELAAPVFNKLQARYPALFLVPGPAAKEAAEKAMNDLAADPEMLKQFESVSQQLSAIDVKQDTILKNIAMMDETLQGVGTAVDGIAKDQAALLAGQATVQELQKALSEQMQSEFRKLELKIDDLHAQAALAPAGAAKELSIAGIYRRANMSQSEAMRYLNAGYYQEATERLQDAKGLAMSGFRRAPNDVRMLDTLGYLEKTSAQISWETGEGDAAARLGDASRYFAKALEIDPEDVGAMNGLADTYIFAKDYDRAIPLGEWVLAKEPNYGAAAWDLAIALEGKIAEAGPDAKLLAKLESTYERLKALIPTQPLQFGPNELAYVEQRLEELRA